MPVLVLLGVLVMAPRSNVIRRRTGEVVERHAPGPARAGVRSKGQFLQGEAEHKSRQRIAGERAGEAKARRRLAEAKAAKAERDAQPSSAGPRGGARVAVGRRPAARASQASRSFDRRVKRFLRLGTASPRRVLMLELVAVMVVVTVDQFTQGQVPTPQAYVAPFVVYLVLGFMAELGGDGGARVATGLGALVLVALVLANAPGIVKALQVVSGQRPQAVPIEGVG